MRTEILRIAHEQNIPTNDVFVVDASKQTKRISANVSGLGPTIRIALNDNLLNRSNIHGIKAVMGHEMGHYKLYHIQKLLLYLTLMALVAFGVMYWARAADSGAATARDGAFARSPTRPPRRCFT